MDKTTKLASDYTVKMYEDDIKELYATYPPNDSAVKERIAEFFERRFTERYITPIKALVKERKHGFCTMAVSCLMIEALQCFWTGDKETPWKKSEAFFDNFFDRTPALKIFKGTTFYGDIRCGILHQAETKGGWKINRENDNRQVLDGRSIDATIFHQHVERALIEHVDLLKKEDKTSVRWEKFRLKMSHVLDNC